MQKNVHYIIRPTGEHQLLFDSETKKIIFEGIGTIEIHTNLPEEEYQRKHKIYTIKTLKPI